ncbi:hypothetical protein MRB53_006273 [Persea americana]|uniref:Uncharacterized protein n=1 Tax=Persea americana TaxID=3435 RepID=A0ACC2MGG3_PERAE|nr:hypothetical protein MRB53_006273 [Persea americana]
MASVLGQVAVDAWPLPPSQVAAGLGTQPLPLQDSGSGASCGPYFHPTHGLFFGPDCCRCVVVAFESGCRRVRHAPTASAGAWPLPPSQVALGVLPLPLSQVVVGVRPPASTGFDVVGVMEGMTDELLAVYMIQWESLNSHFELVELSRTLVIAEKAVDRGVGGARRLRIWRQDCNGYVKRLAIVEDREREMSDQMDRLLCRIDGSRLSASRGVPLGPLVRTSVEAFDGTLK